MRERLLIVRSNADPLLDDHVPMNMNDIVNWAQIVSAVLGLVALCVALYALFKTKADLIAERKNAHDLDLLREIGLPHIGYRGESAIKMWACLKLVPHDEFPLTRAAVGADPTEDSLKTFGQTYADAPALNCFDDPNTNSTTMQERLNRVRFDGTLYREYSGAVAKRLTG